MRLYHDNDPSQSEKLDLRSFSKNEHSSERVLTSMLQDKKSHKVLKSLRKSQQSPSKEDVMNTGYVRPVWKFYIIWGFSDTGERAAGLLVWSQQWKAVKYMSSVLD